MRKPYYESILSENTMIRGFSQSVSQSDLVWHRDRQDRVVEVIHSNGWLFQRDDSVPALLSSGDILEVTAYEWHRLIKGKGDLVLKIIEEKKIKFDDLFKVKDGQHPPLVKLFLASKITLETMIILNDILGYTKQFNKQINENVIWPKKYKLMMNYKPFLRYNLTKMKMIIKRKINDR